MKKAMREITVIKKVGIEVEGCFLNEPNILGWETKRDSSVRNVNHYPAYEIASNPTAFDKRTRLFDDIARLSGYSPLDGRLFYCRDETAGLHAHVSMRQEYLPFLNSQAMLKRIVKRIKGDERISENTKKELIRRLRKNEYCANNAHNEGFLGLFNNGRRYVAVNFMALFRHGTVEFRFLPTAEPKEMAAMLEILFRVVEAHLQKVRLRALRLGMTMPEFNAYVLKLTAIRADTDGVMTVIVNNERREKNVQSVYN